MALIKYFVAATIEVANISSFRKIYFSSYIVHQSFNVINATDDARGITEVNCQCLSEAQLKES